jgi:signal transduction histidine kinase
MNSIYASAFVGVLQLAVPSYGLRLNRRFGSREVGWALVVAFLVLALLNLVGGVGPGGARREWELARGGAAAAIPVLLLIGMAHIETLLRERTRLERQQRLRHCELEQHLDERTKELADAKEEFHLALCRKDQEQRAIAERAQQERLELAARFATSAGQRLNQHVAVIELYTKLLLAKESDAAKFPYYERLVAGAVAARTLGRQLVACGGHQPLRMQLWSLSDIVRWHEPALRDLLGEHRSLECTYRPDVPLIWADPQVVSWMLEELIWNAVNAMPAGGRISITVEPATVNQPPAGIEPCVNQFAAVVMTDTGHGASREVQRHMGEPFFTTARGLHAGLGLASVSGLARAHGGWLTVTSALGHGTTVRLFFPTVAKYPAGNQPTAEEYGRRGNRVPEASVLSSTR